MVNKEKREKFYLSIIEWGAYLSIFTPMVFFRYFFFPFVSPKTIFFRMVIEVIFVAYLFLIISNRKYLPRLNGLTIAVAAYLLIVMVASLLGVNPLKSFWSVFERMTGGFTLLHLFAFFLILSSVFTQKKYWKRILTLSMIVGALICLQVWTATEDFARGGGTLGNTSFLAGYMLFNIFFALTFFLTQKGAGQKILYGVLLLICTLGLFISQEPCRGAIGAFFGGLFVIGFAYLMRRLLSSGKKSLKILAFSLPVILILAVVLFFQLDYAKERVMEIWESSSLQSRLIVWKIGYDGWRERPLLGWGEDNFYQPFAKYFNPELPLTLDIWYDRAHNIVLDVLVASGILGLLGYLAIFGVAIFSLVRVFPRFSGNDIFFPLGMIAMLLVYFAQNIWVFDMISSYMMFFLSLAFINFLISEPDRRQNQDYSKQGRALVSVISAILVVASAWFFFFGNIQAARASNAVIKGLSFPVKEATKNFQEAYKISPVSRSEIPEQFSRRIIELIASSSENEKEDLKKGLLAVEETFKKGIQEDPPNFRMRLFLGEFYNSAHQYAHSSDLLDISEQVLNQAMQLSPKNQQVYWGLGQTMLFKQQYRKAGEYFQKAIDLEPHLAESHWYMFLCYKVQSEYNSAQKEFYNADSLGYAWRKNAGAVKQVIDLYRYLLRNDMIVSVAEEAVKRFPKDAQLWGMLGDGYAAIGEREKAKAAAEKVMELRPDLRPQLEQFLSDLGY